MPKYTPRVNISKTSNNESKSKITPKTGPLTGFVMPLPGKKVPIKIVTQDNAFHSLSCLFESLTIDKNTSTIDTTTSKNTSKRIKLDNGQNNNPGFNNRI